MPITGRQVLDMALVLIDEVTEGGGIAPDNPKYYETKALTMLSMVQSELLPLDVEPPIITDLDEPLLISDRLAIKVASYGVASKLALAEDANLAVTLNNMYDELKKKIPTAEIQIVDVYSLNGSDD